ncbi:2-deoxyglucose-6-phosphatase [Erwinia sp. OLTSP20]|uniref:hexitol phosphatase HxpB n=1 Tax=unclassified Erwinia TaxID=2622719 RepID=UPI000C17CD15|nr:MULTISPECIES: hexitol phosphatase HxpB [unclassified Erwinia]PIJ51856.1 2-deoxyglucose-6-phosphatase [Erwinia sp. OAMSP11]PIJ74444.1 2-deoxyglucose-6-phosphatase [Erwinia sp. OLSSP12]PIJ83723.1 2-deoxyglucose-6-phosphatase [Erwinia sp. OLCASP19]PIJ86766.1 2-deoxyglucose-6-phosphatase [Erwinia sp. OLMTSP26]PIJ88173.1 2-deoxyglucose-6-phosphatase [Erwinia sp. OLMDSP33]
MSYSRPVQAAIFDMDGLLIDSEPLWKQSELEVFASLGVDLSRASEIPETLGLRIDQTVNLWFEVLPWSGPDRQQVTGRIIALTLSKIEQSRPLLPGVVEALALCKSLGLKIGLASASPLHMLETVTEMFAIRRWFDVLVSAEMLPYSKPHPQVYLDAALQLAVDPLNCVTLEDSFNGMIATKAARMRSVVVPAAELRHDPRWALADVRLHSLEALRSNDLTGVASHH